MSAGDVLDVAYTILAERADAADRALLSSLREIDGLSSRQQLNQNLGLHREPVSEVNPTGADVIPGRRLSLAELAEQVGVA